MVQDTYFTTGLSFSAIINSVRTTSCGQSPTETLTGTDWLPLTIHKLAEIPLKQTGEGARGCFCCEGVIFK